MSEPDDIHSVLDRIIKGVYTEHDIALVRRALNINDENDVQLAKYNIRITRGQDVQIGDRIYHGVDAETIRHVFDHILSTIIKNDRDAPIPDWPQVCQQYLERLQGYFEKWSERYTDLRLTTDIRVATYKGYRIKHGIDKGQWWFREALNAHDNRGDLLRQCVVILGDPGAGKTTACQRAVWELATEGLKSLHDQADATVPIYLELSTYRTDAPHVQGLAPYQKILSALAQEMRRLFAAGLTPINIQWAHLESYLRVTPFIFFLDGLNEVGVQHREELIADIMSFVDTFGGRGHQFVITTRKFDYEYELAQFLPADRFKVLEILELDSRGVNEFVMRDLGQITQAYHYAERLPSGAHRQALITALDRLKTGDVTGGEEPLIQIRNLLRGFASSEAPEASTLLSSLQAAHHLLAILRHPDYSRVLWLSQNPATLKDIVDVYQDKHTIPRSRVILFEKAIQARLATQAAKLSDQRTRFPEEVKFDMLQAIAVLMIEPGEGLSVRRERVLERIATILKQKHPGHPPEQAGALLHEVVFSDGLLVEKTFGEYSFVKQPYQEYFVARELRDRWLAVTKTNKNPLHDKGLRRFLSDRDYFQVVSSMAGLLEEHEVSGLVQRLRKYKSTWRLAALCVRNAEALPTELVEDFTAWTQKHILRFVAMPEGLTNLLLVALFLVIYALSLNIEAPYIMTQGTLLSTRLLSQIRSGPRVNVILASVVTGTLSLAAWWILQRASISAIRSPSWRSWGIRLLGLVTVTQLILLWNLGGNWLQIPLATLAPIALAFLVGYLAYVVLVPFASWANTYTEERIVNRHLIPLLEVLRDIGPSANSAINEIQHLLARDRFVAERIKDTIERTWAVSPRTVLQVIAEIDDPSRQAEAVKVLETAILRTEITSAIRERAALALFHLVDHARTPGTLLGAIDALQRLAQEYMDYREQVIRRLKHVMDQGHPFNVRQRAWRALRDLGLYTLPPPQPTARERIAHSRPIIMFLLLVLSLVVFLGLAIFPLLGIASPPTLPPTP